MCCSTSSAIILILLSAFSECSLSCTPSPLLWEFYQYRNTSNQQNVCIICPKIKAWPIYSLETSGTYLFNMIVSIWYLTVAIRHRPVPVQRCHHPVKQRRRALIGWMKQIDLVFFLYQVSQKLFICSNDSPKMHFLVYHNIFRTYSDILFLIMFCIKLLLNTHLRQVKEI